VKLGRIEHRKLRSRRSEAVILFGVGPHRFAIAAQAVEEIRSSEGLRPFAHGHARIHKVRYWLQREGKNYFVLDTNLHLRMFTSKATRLLLLRDFPIALTADSIDRMAEIAVLHPLPRAFHGEERGWYRGLALLGEDVVPVLQPMALLAPQELASLAAALARAEAANEARNRKEPEPAKAAAGS
jgi:chemotaxis signal transduction protein